MNWWGDGEEERVGDEGGGVEVDRTRKNIFICFSFLQDFRSSPSLISFCRGGGGEVEEGEREEEEEGEEEGRRRGGGGGGGEEEEEEGRRRRRRRGGGGGEEGEEGRRRGRRRGREEGREEGRGRRPCNCMAHVHKCMHVYVLYTVHVVCCVCIMYMYSVKRVRIYVCGTSSTHPYVCASVSF